MASLRDVEDLIALRFRRPAPAEWSEDLDLGPSGFGLDSISLVELLLLCEERFGVPFPFTLFGEGPMTPGRILTCARIGLRRHADDTDSAKSAGS